MNEARRIPGDDPSAQGEPGDARLTRAMAEAHAHAAAGRYGMALSVIREVSATHRQNANLLFAEAAVLSAWGRFRDVCGNCEPPWAESCRHVSLFLTLGWSRLSTGNPRAAEAWMYRAADAEPENWQAQFSLGAALQQLGRLDEAVASYKRALVLEGGDNFDCRINLGVCRFEQGKFPEAEAEARRALTLDSARPIAWENLALALARQDLHVEAAHAFQRAMQLEAEHGNAGGSFVNAANNLLNADQVESALTLYEGNLGKRPSLDAHHDYAFALLTAGRLIEGWHHYEFRWLKNPLLPLRPRFDKPLWEGQNLRGKTILIQAEQGFGDTIHFLRYASSVKALGATVLLRVDGFGMLAARFRGIDAIVDPRGAPPAFDFHVHLLSLPRIFGTDLASIPADVPYVEPGPEHVSHWANRLGPNDGRLKVGLAWAGRPTHKRDLRRSIALDTLAPLGRVAGVRYVGLQKDAAPAPAETAPISDDFVNLGPELRDFADTAAVIANLDLIVCVDTAVGHLAGAMGKPVWLMLSRPADFRWMRQGDATPWYPTMRLFRQNAAGDWAAVIEGVRGALDESIRTGGASMQPRRDLSTKGPPLIPRRTMTRDSPGHKQGFSAVAETRVGIVQYFPDEAVVGDSIDWYGEYLQPQLDLLRRIVKPGMTLVEADAGVGMHALFLAERAGPSGHLYLYESRPLLQRALRHNLAANRIGNVTLMRRSLRCAATPTDDKGTETIDDLQLRQLHVLKVGEHTPPLDVIAGATETIWRLRPLLFVAVSDEAAMNELIQKVRDFGYRCWRMETALFNPENFNRREEDIFRGRKAMGLLAVPEEIGVGIGLEECTEVAVGVPPKASAGLVKFL